MKREIKFRTWTKLDGMKYYGDQPAYILLNGDLYFDDFTGTHLRVNDKLMQYTGLKDKNGKEIYEGDVVKNSAAEWEVIFHTGCFCGKRIHGSDGTQNMHLALRAIHEIEIIGNIYENPNLLEK